MMVDVLCATEFLSQARAAKVNNVEGGTEEQAEFPGDQKRYPGRGESGWLPRGECHRAGILWDARLEEG